MRHDAEGPEDKVDQAHAPDVSVPDIEGAEEQGEGTCPAHEGEAVVEMQCREDERRAEHGSGAVVLAGIDRQKASQQEATGQELLQDRREHIDGAKQRPVKDRLARLNEMLYERDQEDQLKRDCAVMNEGHLQVSPVQPQIADLDIGFAIEKDQHEDRDDLDAVSHGMRGERPVELIPKRHGHHPGADRAEKDSEAGHGIRPLPVQFFFYDFHQLQLFKEQFFRMQIHPKASVRSGNCFCVLIIKEMKRKCNWPIKISAYFSL